MEYSLVPSHPQPCILHGREHAAPALVVASGNQHTMDILPVHKLLVGGVQAIIGHQFAEVSEG